METPTERLLETQMNLTVEMFSSVCEALVFINVTPQGYYFSFYLHLGLRVCILSPIFTARQLVCSDADWMFWVVSAVILGE